ncbi:hypothetical protein HanRHA438_Chr17g0811491 [Helianthus annuus]|nr:hypothetical protein HanRHA438_Chr17g0811491 [Helianthus annuus]
MKTVRKKIVNNKTLLEKIEGKLSSKLRIPRGQCHSGCSEHSRADQSMKGEGGSGGEAVLQ